jgi:hypothetical protein
VYERVEPVGTLENADFVAMILVLSVNPAMGREPVLDKIAFLLFLFVNLSTNSLNGIGGLQAVFSVRIGISLSWVVAGYWR